MKDTTKNALIAIRSSLIAARHTALEGYTARRNDSDMLALLEETGKHLTNAAAVVSKLDDSDFLEGAAEKFLDKWAPVLDSGFARLVDDNDKKAVTAHIRAVQFATGKTFAAAVRSVLSELAKFLCGVALDDFDAFASSFGANLAPVPRKKVGEVKKALKAAEKASKASTPKKSTPKASKKRTPAQILADIKAAGLVLLKNEKTGEYELTQAAI